MSKKNVIRTIAIGLSMLFILALIVTAVSKATASKSSIPAHTHDTITFIVGGKSDDVASYSYNGNLVRIKVPSSITTIIKDSFYHLSVGLNGPGSATCIIKVNGKTVSSVHTHKQLVGAQCGAMLDQSTGQWVRA